MSIASDGNVIVGSTTTTSTTGWWLFKKATTEVTSSIQAVRGSSRKEGELVGFKLYSRDSIGDVKHFTPVGGLDHEFHGINDLIDSAKAVKPAD